MVQQSPMASDSLSPSPLVQLPSDIWRRIVYLLDDARDVLGVFSVPGLVHVFDGTLICVEDAANESICGVEHQARSDGVVINFYEFLDGIAMELGGLKWVNFFESESCVKLLHQFHPFIENAVSFEDLYDLVLQEKHSIGDFYKRIESYNDMEIQTDILQNAFKDEYSPLDPYQLFCISKLITGAFTDILSSTRSKTREIMVEKRLIVLDLSLSTLKKLVFEDSAEAYFLHCSFIQKISSHKALQCRGYIKRLKIIECSNDFLSPFLSPDLHIKNLHIKTSDIGLFSGCTFHNVEHFELSGDREQTQTKNQKKSQDLRILQNLELKRTETFTIVNCVDVIDTLKAPKLTQLKIENGESDRVIELKNIIAPLLK